MLATSIWGLSRECFKSGSELFPIESTGNVFSRRQTIQLCEYSTQKLVSGWHEQNSSGENCRPLKRHSDKVSHFATERWHFRKHGLDAIIGSTWQSINELISLIAEGRASRSLCASDSLRLMKRLCRPTYSPSASRKLAGNIINYIDKAALSSPTSILSHDNFCGFWLPLEPLSALLCFGWALSTLAFNSVRLEWYFLPSEFRSGESAGWKWSSCSSETIKIPRKIGGIHSHFSEENREVVIGAATCFKWKIRSITTLSGKIICGIAACILQVSSGHRNDRDIGLMYAHVLHQQRNALNSDCSGQYCWFSPKQADNGSSHEQLEPGQTRGRAVPNINRFGYMASLEISWR